MKAGMEKKAGAVFGRVLKEIKPTKEELQESVYTINQITGRLKKIVPKEVEIRVVGSVVRGTHLRGESDIDVFLLFSKKQNREKITKDGIEYAKRIITDKKDRWEVKYAEHPYARLYLNSLGVQADIVPAFNIDNIEDMGTAVDRSPMHADFMNSHLNERHRDEVRLLKYLLKRNGLYGAEVMTSGFSGYLCELLVYHYGSLWSLLENAASLKPPILLAPKSKSAVSDPSLVKKFNSVFVVIDPVDENRNVAAGVSVETLSKFVLLARQFTKKPSPSFFGRRDSAHGKGAAALSTFLKKSGLHMYALEAKVPDKSEDVVWPQLRKVMNLIADYSEKFGFRIYLSMPIVSGQHGLLVFFAPEEKIRTRMQKGPSVFIRKAQEEFMKAHADSMGITVRGDSLFSLDKNRYENLEQVMRDFASGKVFGKRKDVTLRGSRLFVDSLPKEYADEVYTELQNRISL
jgi:tRNA nucleotidyltransferase (CCA-adding enzyme)